MEKGEEIRLVRLEDLVTSYAPSPRNFTDESLRELLRLLSDFANNELGAEVALGMSHKRRGAGATGHDSASVKLLVKSRTIWALMARAYGRLD
jgi:hypothetical protein